MLPNPELWNRIEAFEVDDPLPAAKANGGAISAAGPRLSFAARLAREGGWSLPFAERVVGEYKRFVYLAMVAGHPVTPSEHVDAAWHLHMVYARSYWERLCGVPLCAAGDPRASEVRGVLPRPLVHGPTRGGESEDRKFDDWYARTLESYRRVFDTEPPRDIWTPSQERFGHDLRWKRVNTQDHWIVPRPTYKRVAAIMGGTTALVACGLAIAALTGSLVFAQPVNPKSPPPPNPATNPGSGSSSDYFWLILAGALVVMFLIGRRYGWSWGDGSGGGGSYDGGGCGGGGCGGGCGGGD